MHCKIIIIVYYIRMDPENKFIKIQEYYDKINKNLENMSEDIDKLNNTHTRRIGNHWEFKFL